MVLNLDCSELTESILHPKLLPKVKMANTSSVFPSTAGFLRSAMKNTCTNCLVYNWKQKEGKVTLRCSGCKIFFYCSKECQEEHWRKTFQLLEYQI